jgi:hypothetical protein
MDLEHRLKQAIQRGEQAREAVGRAAQARELTEEDLRRMHGEYRLALSEHIEQGLRRLADYLPGFTYSNVFSEDGWGARLTRDDLKFSSGKVPESQYSRFEIVVSPFSPAVAILDLVVKGTVRNREAVNRKHYQKLTEVDLGTMRELIDQRIVEFAELYSASR